MKSYKIYKYTNLITGMSYIGQTCRKLKTRAGRNMEGYRGCEKFWEAIKAYGTDCWQSEILWDGLTLDEANIYEQLEIRDNDTLYPSGYNMSLGGFNTTHSPETKAKISANNGMNRPEVKAKHMKRLKENNPLLSPEVKEKTRKKNRERLKEDNPTRHPKNREMHSKRMRENNPMNDLETRKKAHRKCSITQLGMTPEALMILIQWLTREGWSLRKIGRELGISKHTIFKYAKRLKARNTP